MCPYVLVEITRLNEVFTILLTFIRLLPAEFPHVFVEIIRLSKGLNTLITFMIKNLDSWTVYPLADLPLAYILDKLSINQ